MRALARCCALTVPLALVACAGGRGGARHQDPCADFEVEVERYWSASVRARVLDYGGELELERRSGVANKMDRISEDWVMMRTSVCKDHFVREVLSAEDYTARARCFDDRLAQQRTLAEALSAQASPDLAAIEQTLDALVADPSSCAAAAP